MGAILLTEKSIYSPPTINMHSDVVISEQLNYLDHVGSSHSSIHLGTDHPFLFNFVHEFCVSKNRVCQSLSDCPLLDIATLYVWYPFV